MSNNIQLSKQNFTVLDGYFYTFDESLDSLLQKTDDGNTAFSYPLDTLITGEVISLEHDGVNFWTLQENGTDAVMIKRWRINNYVCQLQETFNFDPDTEHKYNVNTFTVSNYRTFLTSSVTVGSSVIYIDKYSDNQSLIVGSTVHIGPNVDGDSEEVIVDSTVFGGIKLTAGTKYHYSASDKIYFHTHIWLLNNYNGVDSSTGALYKFDSHTGIYITKYVGGQYKDITASTFSTINSFIDYGPVDTLIYIKGTNALFVNVDSQQAVSQDASDLNDQFTGNAVPPNQDRWDVISGFPELKNDLLFMTIASGIESISSDYYLRGDFDVEIDCTLGNHPTYSGAGHFTHSFGLLFPNESDRYCYIARANNTDIGGYDGQDNFHTLYNKDTTNISEITTSGVSYSTTNYNFKISRAGANISFYYKVTVTGTWTWLDTIPMFESDCKLALSLDNTTGTTVDSTFDNLIYSSGEAVYFSTATSLPFYGSMVMDNIAGYTSIIPIYDLATHASNMYRLQHDATYNYYLSPLDHFITSISLSASPAIIAANGLSTSTITAAVKDQFLQPIAGRRITFAENGDGAITGGTQRNTGSDGKASTVYTAGTQAQDVQLTAVAEQTN